MNYLKLFVCIMCLTLLATNLDAARQPMNSTSYMGFNPATGLNNASQGIVYKIPDPKKFGTGPFPLFVWTPGLYEPYKDGLAVMFVTQMADRGFVAASVQYKNFNVLQICSEYEQRALGVFESARANSAVSVLCSLSGVDCGKGIVTAGVSQGAAIAILAKNYAPDVEAVYAMSMSNYNQLVTGVPLPCLDAQNTAIAANRLVVVNGENDPSFSGQEPIQNTSGYSCPAGSVQCWSPEGNGAGWYIVQNSQVSDGNADHCYMLVRCGYSLMEKDWSLPATYNWSMKPNLDWLASFGRSRTFSPTGQ